MSASIHNDKLHNKGTRTDLIHMKSPRFQLAHLGSLFLLQSAHILFPGNLSSDLMTAWFAAALSAALAAAGLGRRDILKARRGREILSEGEVQSCGIKVLVRR